TAGVYLVIRSNEIFSQITEVSHFIVYLGAFVAVFAASMALVHNDLKKIIAYSTLSQLGYMFVAAGFGAYWIALFHLMTHAFFKSLLFLGAGNIMHATNDELNIQKMGGLYKFLKPTAVLMIIASLALAGFYPLSGFFSKDKILEVAFNENSFFIWFVLLCGAILTAFYSFRLIMLVFFGEERKHYHAHEAKGFMLRSMGLLAALSICSGFFEHKFESFAGEILPKYEFILNHSVAILLIFITTLCVALSTIFAIFAYKKGIFKDSIKEKAIYKILSNQYYIPQIYEKFITKNYFKFSEFCAKMDANFIDKSVDLIAKYILKSGGVANRTMQSGELSLMLRYMVCGFVILLVLAFVYKG
ncbi:MAG: NADH-quinone oxidoreductase subunit L, partial [Campylobacter sp.]|nr:NADH-quinone oxidoreductase subunit L [Campylobacter sp.]